MDFLVKMRVRILERFDTGISSRSIKTMFERLLFSVCSGPSFAIFQPVAMQQQQQQQQQPMMQNDKRALPARTSKPLSCTALVFISSLCLNFLFPTACAQNVASIRLDKLDCLDDPKVILTNGLYKHSGFTANGYPFFQTGDDFNIKCVFNDFLISFNEHSIAYIAHHKPRTAFRFNYSLYAPYTCTCTSHRYKHYTLSSKRSHSILSPPVARTVASPHRSQPGTTTTCTTTRIAMGTMAVG